MRFYPRNRLTRHDAVVSVLGRPFQHPLADTVTRRDRDARYNRGNGIVVTATGNAHACNESDIVTGGKVLTLTVTGDDRWALNVLANAALVTAFPATDGLRAALALGNFTVNAAYTVVTLTLPAIAAYDISVNASYDLTLDRGLFKESPATVVNVAAIVVTAGA